MRPLPQRGEAFGAKVFKIARDKQNNRLTYLKVTGGCLRVKDLLHGRTGAWRKRSIRSASIPAQNSGQWMRRRRGQSALSPG